MAKILVVEDDVAIGESLKQWLESDHHAAEVVSDGLEAWDFLMTYDYDLIVLDWQLPSISGIDLCKRFRKKGKHTPILMLTGRGEVNDRVEGLDSGADDYVTKPFSMKEVQARVRALLRRASGEQTEIISLAGISLDTVSRRVMVQSDEIKLKPLEYGVLEFFMRNPNKVLSPELVLQHVWSSNSEASVDSVYVCINRIRKKLGPAGECIRTLHTLGYQFLVPGS
jgi:DNA-binding response OmpR family regulator